MIDAAGKTLYPGLIDGLTTLGLAEMGSVAGPVDTTEVGRREPARAGLGGPPPPQRRSSPVARANGVTAALGAPAGGLVSGQSALVRLAGTTPDEMTVKAPVALHVVYPSGRPAFDVARLFDEPELKTFEERLKEKEKNQEKALRGSASLLAEAKAHAAAVAEAGRGTRSLPETPALEALAPFARGEAPVVIRADDEDDIRGAVHFAERAGAEAS